MLMWVTLTLIEGLVRKQNMILMIIIIVSTNTFLYPSHFGNLYSIN